VAFLRFVREHVLVSFLIVLGTVTTVYGILSDAYSAYQLGLPSWAWQIVGFLVLVSALVVFMYRTHLGLPSVARPQAELPRSAPGASPRANDLSFLIRRTLQAVRMARTDGRNRRNVELALPEVNAVLLTLQKEKGIRLPNPVHQQPESDLEVRCRLLEKLAPLIRQGHDEEARRVAEEYSERMDKLGA
jgi:hypothetical protein